MPHEQRFIKRHVAGGITGTGIDETPRLLHGTVSCGHG
jgi:hypothetical protein